MYCIPFSFKDPFDTKDMRSTGGGDARYDIDVPARDHVLVDQLRKKGAIIFAKAVNTEYNGRAGNPGVVTPFTIEHFADPEIERSDQRVATGEDAMAEPVAALGEQPLVLVELAHAHLAGIAGPDRHARGEPAVVPDAHAVAGGVVVAAVAHVAGARREAREGVHAHRLEALVGEERRDADGVVRMTAHQGGSPYNCAIALSKLGNDTGFLCPISKDGFGITASARKYLDPLIRGEAYPPYAADGLPAYVRLRKQLAEKKLPPFSVLYLGSEKK